MVTYLIPPVQLVVAPDNEYILIVLQDKEGSPAPEQ